MNDSTRMCFPHFMNNLLDHFKISVLQDGQLSAMHSAACCCMGINSCDSNCETTSKICTALLALRILCKISMQLACTCSNWYLSAMRNILSTASASYDYQNNKIVTAFPT